MDTMGVGFIVSFVTDFGEISTLVVNLIISIMFVGNGIKCHEKMKVRRSKLVHIEQYL